MAPGALLESTTAPARTPEPPPILPAGGGAPSLIVTGQPNVGKSVVFQLLTGRYTTVSNYPGTTVMSAAGFMRLAGQSVTVHDTPGLNSLMASSEDEAVARDLLLGRRACVLQVADAKNLPRALAVSLQLAEAGLTFVLSGTGQVYAFVGIVVVSGLALFVLTRRSLEGDGLSADSYAANETQPPDDARPAPGRRPT